MEELYIAFRLPLRENVYPKQENQFWMQKKISSYKNILSDVSRKDEAGFQCIKQKYISSIKTLKNIQKINLLPVIDEIH